MSTSYADSAQAREWERRFDSWGRPKQPALSEFHDYEAAALRSEAREARKAREIQERKSLSRRIGLAMAQMEMICPPKGGAA